ncbi:hypothetical protein RFI_11655 [Reticulomyxa filosa]|uniref:Leucine carboxyl methyltransferase 1 n=1 Tax=Reticulomyxa filosa TaxID=46433 RepID=X6NJF8_RETFI|nr:hypothetical protein RFI_11655 [Reticulomyxa filosa]|eukprot:ETO25482.1 hypothetical protein RFI_11655 [Reticulomyxa filosa]
MENPETVAATADDAILSKLCCVRTGYYKDPFVQAGYWARVAAFDEIIINFLESDVYNLGKPELKKCKQILSLGAGLDTTFWRLFLTHKELLHKSLHKYIEVDFQETTFRKMQLLSKNKGLFLENPDIFQTDDKPVLDMKHGAIFSNQYALIPGDLCEWDAIVKLWNEKFKKEIDLDYNSPTLILSECVFIYIPAKYSSYILDWCHRHFLSGCAIAIYEQILPNDGFGQQMIRNLRLRTLFIYSLIFKLSFFW